MKKKLTILATLLIAAGMLVGCGAKGDNNNNNGNGNESKLTGSLEDIMTDVQGKLGSEIMTFNEPVDLSDAQAVTYNLGLSDAKGIKEAVSSNAMISTHAYSTVLVRVDSDADAKEIAKNMVAGVDLMKWICVGADDTQSSCLWRFDLPCNVRFKP